jgi:hypothetical protein
MCEGPGSVGRDRGDRAFCVFARSTAGFCGLPGSLSVSLSMYRALGLPTETTGPLHHLGDAFPCPNESSSQSHHVEKNKDEKGREDYEIELH